MYVSDSKKTQRQNLQTKINTALSQLDNVSGDVENYLKITIGDVEFTVTYSWSYNMGRFGSQAKSYVELTVVGFYEEVGTINFNRKNKVEIKKAEKNPSFIIEKAEKIASELVSARTAIQAREERKNDKASQVKAIFEEKGYVVERVYNTNSYGTITVETSDYIYKVQLTDGKVMIKETRVRNFYGIELPMA